MLRLSRRCSSRYYDRVNTQQLLEAAERSLLFVTDREPAVMQSGSGMYLEDSSGKRYLDFVGGWAVTGLGHSPVELTEALSQQAAKLLNASPAFYNVPMIEFAAAITAEAGLSRVFFCSSGAEANESAIKLARKYGKVCKSGAYEILCAEHGFHGRTLATMSASGKAAFRPLFEPKVPGFRHLPFNDATAFEKAIGDQTCAVLLEPIQGEAGVYPATQDFIERVRNRCSETDTLLIFDEIQTGMGRTGRMFAFEHFDIKPDILTLGKNIGGGFPLAAMLCTEELNLFDKGEQGGTYTGQPLAMAVGLAVLRTTKERDLVNNAEHMGAIVQKRLSELVAEFGLSKIRGHGLLIAFDLPEPKGPDLVHRCFERGLLLNAPAPTVIRLVPPLIVEEAHIEEMITVLTEVMRELGVAGTPE